MKIDLVFSQVFIIVGYLLFFLSRFRKEKQSILFTDSVSRICSIIGYIILHSVNGDEHTLYGIIRNTIGQRLEHCKKLHKVIAFILMLLILLIMYGVSFEGLSTLMLMISGSINLTAAIFLDAQGIRLGTLIAALCNIIAFLLLGSYASVIGEILCGIIAIVSYVKEKIK